MVVPTSEFIMFLDIQPGKEREQKQSEFSAASVSSVTSSWPPNVEAANHSTPDTKERPLAQDNQVIRCEKGFDLLTARQILIKKKWNLSEDCASVYFHCVKGYL